MENNLAELKKEFNKQFGSIVNSQTLDSLNNSIWRFIQDRFVPKSECEELKAENEKLSANGIKLGYFIFKDACGEQVRKEVYDNYTGFKQVLPIGLDRIIDIARTEERARVKKAIESVLLKRLMDNSIDFISINATQLSEEFDKAITADQQGKTV